MASPNTTTMGDLAQIVPDNNEEKEAFLLILQSIQKNYPSNWESWQVTNHSIESFAGSSKGYGKFRFGIPTSELFRAFYPDDVDLSEKSYRQISSIILSWPLGMALLYSPHAIMAQIHASSYTPFMNTISYLKARGKLTITGKTSSQPAG
ncbi:uncharacterized protein LOC118732665, partial [Rhagoletis pomonella]|uniref:uncharacterized protein LOC118732665 n=1 Tax=Rhagoletis pomonella TaxID=28610 RepID=UPI0017805C1B